MRRDRDFHTVVYCAAIHKDHIKPGLHGAIFTRHTWAVTHRHNLYQPVTFKSPFLCRRAHMHLRWRWEKKKERAFTVYNSDKLRVPSTGRIMYSNNSILAVTYSPLVKIRLSSAAHSYSNLPSTYDIIIHKHNEKPMVSLRARTYVLQLTYISVNKIISCTWNKTYSSCARKQELCNIPFIVFLFFLFQ